MDDAVEDIPKLSNEELKNLIDNENAFEDYFLNVKGVKTLSDGFSKTMEALRTQAEDNIKAKEDIDKLYSEYTEVRQEYEELKKQEQEIMKKVSKQNVVAWLDTKIKEYSAIAKEVKGKFEAEELDFGQYIKEFRYGFKYYFV